MSSFIDEARQAGVSDEYIIDYLAEKHGFPVKDAREAGVAESVLLDFFREKDAGKVQAPDATMIDRAKDAGIDVAKGVIGLGRGAVGLASMATGGAVGKGMRAIGYDPDTADKILSSGYSAERQEEERKLEGASGLIGSAMALVSEPGMLVGKAIETAPMMLTSMGVARTVAARAGMAAKDAAIKAGVTSEAEIAKLVSDATKKAATWAAAAAEGAQQSGASFDEFVNNGVDIGRAYAASILSGAITGGISGVAGRVGTKIGLGDVEAGVAGSGNRVVRGLKGAGQEAILEEGLQSPQEQAWSNVAYQKPIAEGVQEAAGQGVVLGGVLGGAFGLASQPPADPVGDIIAKQSAETDALKVDVETIKPTSVDAAEAAPVLSGSDIVLAMADSAEMAQDYENRKFASLQGRRASLAENTVGRPSTAAEAAAVFSSAPESEIERKLARREEIADAFSDEDTFIPADIRLAVRKMESDLREGEKNGTVYDEKSGETTGFPSTNPEWFKKSNLDKYDRKNFTNLARQLNRISFAATIKKVRNGEELTPNQSEVWDYIREQAATLQATDRDLVAGREAERIQNEEGITIGETKRTSVGSLLPGDKVVVEGKNGVPDLVEHRGFDADGNAILKDGVTLHVDQFAEIDVLGKKEGPRNADADRFATNAVASIMEATRDDISRMNGEFGDFFAQNAEYAPYRDLIRGAIDKRAAELNKSAPVVERHGEKAIIVKGAPRTIKDAVARTGLKASGVPSEKFGGVIFNRKHEAALRDIFDDESNQREMMWDFAEQAESARAQDDVKRRARGFAELVNGQHLGVQKTAESERQTSLFDTMVNQAARWKGAAQKVAEQVRGDKKAQLAISRKTTKGDLDSYLMKKFGISESEARDVSNALTRDNIAENLAMQAQSFNPRKSKPGDSAPLQIDELSEKSIIVRGDTKTHKERIKAVGGALWNKNKGGWVFAKKNEGKVREKLADLLGESEGAEEQKNGKDAGNENGTIDLSAHGKSLPLPGGNGQLRYTVTKNIYDDRYIVSITNQSPGVANVYGKGDTPRAAFNRAVSQLKKDLRDGVESAVSGLDGVEQEKQATPKNPEQTVNEVNVAAPNRQEEKSTKHILVKETEITAPADENTAPTPAEEEVRLAKADMMRKRRAHEQSPTEANKEAYAEAEKRLRKARQNVFDEPAGEASRPVSSDKSDTPKPAYGAGSEARWRQNKLDEAETAIPALEAQIAKPFPKADELEKKRARLEEVVRSLAGANTGDGNTTAGPKINTGTDGAEPTFSRKSKATEETYGPGAQTEETEKLQERLAKYTDRAGRGKGIGDGTFTAADIPDGALREIGEVAKIFGKRVVFFHNKRADILPIDGVTFPDMPGVIFIDANASEPHMTVLGHEIVEAMKREDEDLYGVFEFHVFGIMKDFMDYREQYLARLTGEEKEVTGDDDIRKELLADFVGEQMTTEKFWDELVEREPTMFRKIMSLVERFLKRVAANLKLKRLGASRYFSDVDLARKHAANAVAKYAKRTMVRGIDQHGRSGLPTFKRKGVPDIIAETFDVPEAHTIGSWVKAAFDPTKIKMASVKKVVSKARTLAVDRLHPIEQLGDRPYKLHSLLGNAHAIISTFLQHGKLSWDGDALTVAGQKDEGFIPWLRGLGDEGRDLFYWIATKRAAVLEREGRENWLTPWRRRKILDSLFAGLSPAERFAKVRRFAELNEQFQEWNRNIIDVAVESGLISDEQTEAWTRDFYLPFYRIMEDEATKDEFFQGPHKSKRHISAQIKRLQGGEEKLGDPIENILRNWSHLIQESQRNVARKSAAEVAVHMGLADIVPGNELFKSPGARRENFIISYQDNGQAVFLKVADPDLFEALSSINAKAFESKTMRVMIGAKRLLTMGATVTAGFRIANLLRDTVHTAIISKGFKPFLDTWKGAVQVWRQSPDYIALMASGGGFGQGYIDSGDPRAAARSIEKILKREGQGARGRIIDTPRRMWEFWERVGHASEMAARTQLYTNLKVAGASHMEAAFQARDLLDFYKSGAGNSVRVIAAITPFLNARIQGLDRVYRGARMDQKTFLVRGAMLTGASLLLWAIFKDDDRYKELEDWEKWQYHHFWVGDKHFRIPKAFEVGAVFSSLFETAGNTLAGEEDIEFFVRFLKHTFTQTFAMTFPAAFGPAIEAFSNRSAFTGRPIESMAQQRLPAGDRSDPWTPEILSDIGRGLNISPKMMEHVVRGHTAAFGSGLLAVADVFYREASVAPDRPSMRLSDLPAIGRFIKDTDDTRNTKYMSRYYEFAKEVEQLAAVVAHYKAIGDYGKAVELSRENISKLRFKRYIGKVNGVFSSIRKRERQIYESTALGPEKKRELLRALQQKKNKLAIEAYRKTHG